MKKKKINIEFKVGRPILILLSLLLITSIVGLLYFKNLYEKAPVEAWLLNGSNKDMYTRNILLGISSNFEKQFITGGSLYIKNEKMINEAKKIRVDICYDYDNVCVFNHELNSDSPGALRNNNPLFIGSRTTTTFKDGFIKNKNGDLFKTRNEFNEKLYSMYLKVTATYGNNSTETFRLNINPDHKMNKRASSYEIPFIPDQPYGDPYVTNEKQVN